MAPLPPSPLPTPSAQSSASSDHDSDAANTHPTEDAMPPAEQERPPSAQEDILLQNLREGHLLWQRIWAEPYARQELTRFGMLFGNAAQICQIHRAFVFNLGNLAAARLVGLLAHLDHRNLMPMCTACVDQRLQIIGVDGQGLQHVDTCLCSAMITEAGECRWCVFQSLYELSALHTALHSYPMPMAGDAPGEVTHELTCACGRDAERHPHERLRLCASCEGIVSVPAHALDGVTHLVCRAGQPSLMLLNGQVVRGPLVGNENACHNHPMQPMGFWIPRNPEFPDLPPLWWIWRDRERMRAPTPEPEPESEEQQDPIRDCDDDDAATADDDDDDEGEDELMGEDVIEEEPETEFLEEEQEDRPHVYDWDTEEDFEIDEDEDMNMDEGG